MQRHNHRFPMNTRVGNRSAVSRFKPVPPIPNDDLATGDPHDTFSFTAATAVTALFVTHRASDKGAKAALAPEITGATLSTGTVGTSTASRDYAPYGVVFLLNTTAGEKVTFLPVPDRDDAAFFMDDWTTVQGFALSDVSLPPLVKARVQRFTLAKYGTASAIVPEFQEDGGSMITSTFSTAYERGGFTPYISPAEGGYLAGTIVSGFGIDEPSLYPNEQSGGWYSTDVWNMQAHAGASVTQVGVRFNQAPADENAGLLIRLALDLSPAASFSHPLNITNESELQHDENSLRFPSVQ